ncbi:MAG: FlgD immunoglobulin-like domain containing protein, partial [Eubacteriales bacterium]
MKRIGRLNIYFIAIIFIIYIVTAYPSKVAAKEMGIDFSDLVDITTSDSNGQAVTTISLRERDSMKKIEELQDLTRVWFTLDKNYESVNIKLPYTVASTLAEHGASVDVRLPDFSYTVPLPGLRIAEYARQLGGSPDKSVIDIIIAWEKTGDLEKVNGFVVDYEITQVAEPSSFKIEISNQGSKIELDRFNSYVTGTLPLSKTVDVNEATGVRVDKNGALVSVPTLFIEKDGKMFAVIKHQSAGVYTVIENRKVFTDVKDHWAREDINTLASKLLVFGTDKSGFSPDQEVTRAQLAVMITRALGVGPSGSKPQFSDVKNSDWYSVPVVTTAEKGIISGFSDGSFRPADYVTREQAVSMIIRALIEVKGNAAISPNEINQSLARFRDKNGISPWARRFVALAVKNGIFTGNTTEAFYPDKTCTRAETSAFIRQMMIKAELIPDLTLYYPFDNLQTNKQSVKVKGHSEPGSSVTINGNPATIDAGGDFTADIKLEKGTNILSVKVIGPLGYLMISYRTVVYDSSLPSLDLKDFSDNLVTNKSILPVAGSAENGSKVVVNGAKAAVDSEGKFNQVVSLNPGKNIITVVATDTAGNQFTLTRTVLYDNVPPVLVLTAPSENIETGSGFTIVTGYTEPGCKVTINDITVPADTEGNFSKAVDLSVDSNGITVTATDTAGNCTLITRTATFKDNRVTGLELPPQIKLGSQISIKYKVSINCYVKLYICNTNGDRVATLVLDQLCPAGSFYQKWDGKSEDGVLVSDGEYRFVVEARDGNGILVGNAEKRQVVARVPVLIKVDDLSYKLSSEALVTLKILKGREPVKTIYNKVFQSDEEYFINWDNTDDKGIVVGDATYTYNLEAVNPTDASFKSSLSGKIIIEKNSPEITGLTINPDSLQIGGRGAVISFHLSEDAKVSLKVLNKAGKTIYKIPEGTFKKAGDGSILWGGRDNGGKYVSSGTYTVVLAAVDNYGKSSKEVRKTLTVKEIKNRLPALPGLPRGFTGPPVKFSALAGSQTPKIIDVSLSPDIINPPNGDSCRIEYTITLDALVSITILDRTNPVKKIAVNESKTAGTYSTAWDGKDEDGNLVRDGEYTIQIAAAGSEISSARSTYKVLLTVEKSDPSIKDVAISPDPYGIGNPMRIKFTLDENAATTIQILKDNGVPVRTVFNAEARRAGSNTCLWDGRDDNGSYIPEGTYFVIINAVDKFGKAAVEQRKSFKAAYKEVVTGLLITPEPFNPKDPSNGIASISYTVPNESTVSVQVLKGSTPVRTLVNKEKQGAGNKVVQWNGKDTAGYIVPDGEYTCLVTVSSLTVASFTKTMKDSIVIEKEPPQITQFKFNPNPFWLTKAKKMTVQYYLSESARVSIEILNGNSLVKTLYTDAQRKAGNNSAYWDGTDSSGKYPNQGSYTVVVKAVDAFNKSTEVKSTVNFAPFFAVISSSPDNDETGTKVDSEIVIKFNDSVLKDSLFGDISLEVENRGIPYAAKLSGDQLTIIPFGNMAYGTKYQVVIPVDAVKNRSGETLKSPYELSFTTENATRDLAAASEVNLSDAVTSRVSSSNQQTVINVTVNETAALTILDKQKNAKTAVISVPVTCDLVVTQLTGSFVQTLNSKGVALKIQTAGTLLTLPVGTVNIENLVSQLGIDVQELVINVSLILKEPGVTESLESLTKKYKLVRLGNPIAIKIEGAAGDKRVDVKSFNKYISYNIQLPDSAGFKYTAAISLDNAYFFPV